MSTALEIDRKEVLRYLGCRGREADERTMRLVEELGAELCKTATVKVCFLESEIEATDHGIWMKRFDLQLPGEDIRAHLDGCKKAALMALTLGVAPERLIRRYETEDLLRAVVLDCCASALCETACDDFCATKLTSASRYQTTRFSPGYGDLPLSLQREFLRILNAERRIGLTCNESYLLLPRKSVTALVGFSESRRKKTRHKCALCALNQNCAYRERGEICENH